MQALSLIHIYQRGLAHLLEHLAFNGTDHFKGNSLQDYLQSIGVQYGDVYKRQDQNLPYKDCDNIIVHVLKKGEGTTSPILTRCV